MQTVTALPSWRWPWDWSLDPSRWFDAVVQWLAGQVLDALNNLWALLESTALSTPDVTSLPQVEAMNATSLVVVNTAYVLVIITAGTLVMTKDTIQIRYGIGQLAPRVIFGMIAANMAPLFVGESISLANALTQALTGEGISSTGAFGQLKITVAASLKNPADLLLSLILSLIIAGLVATLMMTWLVRIGVLVVLSGAAPLALACHGLPQLEPVAKMWWRSILATLATVVVQALLLHTALAIFLDPGANRQALGLDAANSSSLNLFVVVALMWATVKVPGLMRRYVTRGGGGSNAGAAFLRMVLVQQLTRGLSHARGRAHTAAGRGARRASRGPDPGRLTTAAKPRGVAREGASTRAASGGGAAGDSVPTAAGRASERIGPPINQRPAQPWPTRRPIPPPDRR